MSSLLKKIKRKGELRFRKEFKKSMKKFKKMVACTSCGRPPRQGEKIDNWHIDKYSERIDLICPECYKETEN